MNLQKRMDTALSSCCGKTLAQASRAEIYAALMTLVKEEMRSREKITGERKLYYVSAEFLMGKLLSNNLINLGWFDEAAVRARFPLPGAARVRLVIALGHPSGEEKQRVKTRKPVQDVLHFL